jgi:hypothetical protein
MNSSNSTEPHNDFHPDFSHDDGDIILCSKDDKRFRTYKTSLSQASAFFLATLSLPQSPVAGSGGTVTADFVALDEDGDTLEGILRMICGRAVPKLDTLDVIEPLLHAAEKYDMPGPISIIREAVSGKPALDPFRVYALSRRYGWQEQADVASTRTLAYNISDEAVIDKISKITDTDAFSKLLRLHCRRKQSFRQFIWASVTLFQRLITPTSNEGSLSYCNQSHESVTSSFESELKWKATDTMERRPLADELCTPQFYKDNVASAIPNCAYCGRKVGTVETTKLAEAEQEISEFIRSLPSTIGELAVSILAVL